MQLFRVPIEGKRQFANNGNYPNPMLEFPLPIEIYTDLW